MKEPKQYLLQVATHRAIHTCAWKITFYVMSDKLAIEYASRMLRREAIRWQGIDFELWREPEQNIICELQVSLDTKVELYNVKEQT